MPRIYRFTYSTFLAGTAQDVSYLIDFLPSYLFPSNERPIAQWLIGGKSLGGHATWISFTHGTYSNNVPLTNLNGLLQSPGSASQSPSSPARTTLSSSPNVPNTRTSRSSLPTSPTASAHTSRATTPHAPHTPRRAPRTRSSGRRCSCCQVEKTPSCRSCTRRSSWRN